MREQFRHILLANNENKPVTNSRDTQEVPDRQGREMLQIVHAFNHQSSILDDFAFYDKRQELMEARVAAAQQQQQHGGSMVATDGPVVSISPVGPPGGGLVTDGAPRGCGAAVGAASMGASGSSGSMGGSADGGLPWS